MGQISKRSWFKIYLLFVYIQVLASCGLQFPSDCLTVISNLCFLLFKSFRILTVFTVFILNFVVWMLYHAGLTVTFWTFLCSLRVSWTSLDCPPCHWEYWSPEYMQKSLMVGKIMLLATSIGGKSLCTCQHSDTLSQKSIWTLLDHTQLILTAMTNLVIFETLQNCPFM